MRATETRPEVIIAIIAGATGIAAAVVAGIASFTASRISYQSAYAASQLSYQSAEQQLEANLIMEAVKVCDKKLAVSNLDFLVRAGFLPNHAAQLQRSLDRGLVKYVPRNDCPKQGASPAPSPIGAEPKPN